MTLVKLNNGAAEIAECGHVFVADDADFPTDAGVVVSLKRLSDDKDALLSRNEPFGVRLGPDDDALALEDVLDRVSLVEIEFPKYVDGRGFSHAQLLRRRLGYKGEVRAVGEVLRDQINYMARCGFDSFVMTPTSGSADDVIEGAIKDFTYAYQRTSGAQSPIFARRHAATGESR